MLIYAELNKDDYDIISYKIVNEVPDNFKNDAYFRYGFTFYIDKYHQGNKICYYFNIENIIPCTCPCTLTNKLRKILRKEKLKNIR